MTSQTAEAAAIARRARNVVAQTIVSLSLAPRFDAPAASVTTLVDVLEPLNKLAKRR